jgi:hypothetical protein
MKKVIILVGLLLIIGIDINAQQEISRIQENIERVKEQKGDQLLTTADEVITKHVEAIGGKEAILSVKTMKIKVRSVRFGTEERTLCRYYKQPNLIISKWADIDTYTLSDGEKVWQVTPDGRREMDAWWAISFSHNRIDGNFIDYKKQGIAYKYIGLKGFETEPYVYYHLRRTFPDGFIEDLYFDVETGLLHATWPTSSPQKENPSFSWDYRDIGGILFPHVNARVFYKATPPHVMLIEDAKVNEDFGEDFFTAYKEKPILK